MATISELSLPQLENILEGHSVGINIECFHDSSNSTHSLSPGRRRVLVAIIVFECFLAPVNILTGMMASEGEGWSLAFVCVFLLWLLLLPIGLILNTGMNPLGILDITKSTLWHLGCCILMFYFFSSVLQISSTLLLQWIPTILDSGLGLSFGIQNLPTDYMYGARDWAMNLVGSLCGGDQPTFRHETHILPVRSQS
ncbi:uncharacterized protein EAF02_005925 [Botrytis sinoallii]|uniref:uncharacterized protein n=1 Tax=Botrytis sinoallii TaxID=1463999 RepID=UPI0019024902|nr:uncharacterized protein EAF02_005925 [Botrytis sinoallii]KAF7882562.1 hypothetical protein EAF02_005925 [Botrytis sinoallii]